MIILERVLLLSRRVYYVYPGDGSMIILEMNYDYLEAGAKIILETVLGLSWRGYYDYLGEGTIIIL